MNHIKSVVARFVGNLFMDTFPTTPAEIVDFGFNYAEGKETELFAAYRKGLLAEHFTAYDLNEAVGDGPKLTALVNKVDPTLKVTTDYDFFSDEE